MSDCGCDSGGGGCDSGGGDTGGCDTGGGDTGCCDSGGGISGGCDSGPTDSGGFNTTVHDTGINISDPFYSTHNGGLFSSSAYPMSSNFDDDNRTTGYSSNKYRPTSSTPKTNACACVAAIIMCSSFIVIFLLVLFLGILS